MDTQEHLMREAVAVCRRGIEMGQGPFGAVIATRAGRIIHAAHNTVRRTGDPTAHAEINVIRESCRTLGTIDLSGHVLAATCEPCPMCASAIHWARLDEVYYGASIEDADQAGFNELPVSCRSLYRDGDSPVQVVGGVLGDQCRELFRLWKEGPDPRPY